MRDVHCPTIARLAVLPTVAALLLSGCGGGGGGGGDTNKQDWYLRPAATRTKATTPSVWKW